MKKLLCAVAVAAMNVYGPASAADSELVVFD